MLKNYIKIAIRNLTSNKLYSFINIAGLALGITAFLFILEYVSLEKSVNQFHTNATNIYRLLNQDPKGASWGEIEPGWAPIAKSKFAEINDFCRFDEGVGKGIVKNEAKNLSFREEKVGYAEGNFFDFFSFPLKAGNSKSFNKADVTFISEKSAKKYFGNNNPIGKTLTLYNQFGKKDYKVEGIFEDIKDNSDINYDMVFSLETLKNKANLNENGWASLENLDSQYLNTFFSVNNNTDYKTLENKLIKLRNELGKENDGTKFRLQPLTELHLAKSLNDDLQHTGDVKYVYMIVGIAFLILLIAWFNYINLSTANTLKRANEVGVRKVIGATRGNLVSQFLGESLLVNILAFGLALILILILQPFFNDLIDKSLSLKNLGDSAMWFYGLAFLLFGSVASGIYTSFTLSNYKPVETLKGKITKTTKGVFLRKSLVVSQFSISIVLILATILIYSQLKYMQNKDLGIKLDQLMVLTGPEVGLDSTFNSRKTAFWNTISKQSYVKEYCNSGSIPSKYYNFTTTGFTQPSSIKGDEFKTYSFAIIGDKYLKTYGIRLLAGRNFTNAECNVEWNDNNKVILNEKAMNDFGFKSVYEAVNSKIKWDERYLEVIGVVKDYHHTSLQKPIDPIIFYPQNTSRYISIRLTPDNLPQKIASLEIIFKSNFEGNPFEYFFVDENFNKSYFKEKQYGQLFTVASIWAIFIASLGLFGLAAYTVESRTKEIGIRKVLGANVLTIVRLLSKDFLLLIVISIIIASPIAYYFMQKWLKDFAYRTEISWWYFAITAIFALLIAVFSVGYQSIKAAMTNPVESLKSE